jgi:5-(carboxyamino)imidazole ribonucleotide mutase
MKAHALVGIVMGSDSDLATMEEAAEVCRRFGVPHEIRVVSAHRTPLEMAEYGRSARARGLRVLVAGAGGAAHLPGMLAAHTSLPVIGVPVPVTALNGLDALLSIVQMPAGVPVATVAIGGARNAGLLAVQIVATGDPALMDSVQAYKEELAEGSREKDRRLQEKLHHTALEAQRE